MLKNGVFQQGFSFFVADLLEKQFSGQDEGLDKTNTKNNLYYSDSNETMQNVMIFWLIEFFLHIESLENFDTAVPSG